MPYLTEGICVAVVHHVKAPVHVHSHRCPLCRQVAAASPDCTKAGCVRLPLQRGHQHRMHSSKVQGTALQGRNIVGLARQQGMRGR